jgi:DNA end-binding protein Ku
MSLLRHKDYQGEVEFDEGRLIVRVLHIDDLITTEVDIASEAQAAFVELVEDYVTTCLELGKQPCKPFKGSFNVRVSPNLHKQVAFAAIEDGETLNSFVVSAIEEKIYTGRHEAINANTPSTIGPRANSTGVLRFSLVTCPIKVIPATSEPGNIASHAHYPQSHANRADEADSTWIIEIDQFVPRNEIDSLYLTSPYYIVPKDKTGQDAYAVIREVIRSVDKVAIAHVNVGSGDHAMALETRENGLLGTLVRSPHEVRDSSEYFERIRDVKITKDMLDLAKHIVDHKSGHFDPKKFWDQYSVAGDLLLRKQKLLPNDKTVPAPPSNVINLMDALRASLSRSKRGRTEKKAPRAADAKPAGKS